jgi:hypothetical protein
MTRQIFIKLAVTCSALFVIIPGLFPQKKGDYPIKPLEFIQAQIND